MSDVPPLKEDEEKVVEAKDAKSIEKSYSDTLAIMNAKVMISLSIF